MKFKKGDRVRSNENARDIHIGTIYIICKTLPDSSTIYFRDDNGDMRNRNACNYTRVNKISNKERMQVRMEELCLK